LARTPALASIGSRRLGRGVSDHSVIDGSLIHASLRIGSVVADDVPLRIALIRNAILRKRRAAAHNKQNDRKSQSHCHKFLGFCSTIAALALRARCCTYRFVSKSENKEPVAADQREACLSSRSLLLLRPRSDFQLLREWSHVARAIITSRTTMAGDFDMEWVLLVSLQWVVLGSPTPSTSEQIQSFASKELCSQAAEAIRKELETPIPGQRVQTFGRVVCLQRK
jgi:hypothetical protein